MKKARRYAEGTDVPVSKTRGEIEALLLRHGAGQILSGMDRERRSGFVGFGHSTPEREFLAHTVLPNGATVGDELEPRLAEAYATGEVRALLPS